MFGLEKVADAFDRMHAEVQRDFDNFLLVGGGRWAGDTFGPDSVATYGTAIGAGIAWSLGTFVMGSGKGLVDVLRLGEGTKSGTLTGVGHDVLRVLNIVPLVGLAAKGVGMGGRAASTMWATRVAGQQGAMSCGPTAIAAGARLSGQNVLMTIEEVGQATGKGIHPNAADFPGLYLSEVTDVLKTTSLTNQELNMTGAGVEAVSAVAAQGKGPVIFGIQYWEKVAGIVRPATAVVMDAKTGLPLKSPLTGLPQRGNMNLGSGFTDAPEHWLVAFRDARGQVMVADQFGVRPIAQLGTMNGVTSEFTLATKALLVSDGALMRGVSAVERVGSTTGPLRAPANAQWLAASFGVNMVVVNAPTTWSLDAGVQNILGKPPREWPGMPRGTLPSKPSSGNAAQGAFGPSKPASESATQGASGPVDSAEAPTPSTIPSPNVLSRTLEQDSLLVLGKLPQNGDSREFDQLVIETGLSNDRVRDALLQLARSGLVSVRKWFVRDGKTTPGSVLRTVRR